MEKQQVLNALDEFQEQVEVIARGAPISTLSAPLSSPFQNFNPSQFLKNLHVIVSAVEPFIPGPTGTILTAIDEVLSKLQVGGTGTPGGPVQIQ